METLFINGKIYTMENEGECFASMLIRDGRIIKLYDETHTPPVKRGRKIIDLDGKAVLPGLIDCHSHFVTSGAIKTFSVPVSEIDGDRLSPDSLSGVKSKLQLAAAGKNIRTPLFCVNYIIPSIIENRLPTSDELDDWLPGRSVIILSMDGHSSSYSSRALKEIGLENQTESGILCGEAHEFNMGRINAYLMKSLSLRSLFAGIAENTADAVSRGLTGIHCLEGFEDDPKDPTVKLLTRLGRGIPLSLRLFPQYMSLDRVRPLTALMLTPRIGGCGAWEMDGSVSSHTAAFYTEYADTPGNSGKCYYSEDQIYTAVTRAHEEGFQITAHAIGPRGIELILGAFERVLAEHDDPDNSLRHRIDHFEFPTPEQVRRAAKLRVIITVQPGFSWMDERFQKSYRRYLSRGQYESQVPLKYFNDLGGIICGGSDSPVQDQNPFLQIQGMVDFPLEAQRLSVFEALRSYTTNAAYAGFEEDERGSLSPGKTADFIVTDKDPFRIPPRKLAGIKVRACYIAGVDWIAKPVRTGSMLLRVLFGRRKRV